MPNKQESDFLPREVDGTVYDSWNSSNDRGCSRICIYAYDRKDGRTLMAHPKKFKSKKALVIGLFWIMLSFPYWCVFGDPAVDWIEKKLDPYWEDR